jgi:hypothetical protein
VGGTFEEVRRHLGVEIKRQWSDQAIRRTTPCLLALFSMTTVTADRLGAEGKFPTPQTAWYKKTAPNFSDAFGAVELRLWQHGNFFGFDSQANCTGFPETSWIGGACPRQSGGRSATAGT